MRPFKCRKCGVRVLSPPTAESVRADIAKAEGFITENAAHGVYGAWGYAQASLNWIADALEHVCFTCGRESRK